MTSAASLGCRNLTSPNPSSPRRTTSRLKFGVSGPHALDNLGVRGAVGAVLSLPHAARVMMHPANAMDRVVTFMFSPAWSTYAPCWARRPRMPGAVCVCDAIGGAVGAKCSPGGSSRCCFRWWIAIETGRRWLALRRQHSILAREVDEPTNGICRKQHDTNFTPGRQPFSPPHESALDPRRLELDPRRLLRHASHDRSEAVAN